RDGCANHKSEKRELQGGGVALEDNPAHRHLKLERLAEIAVGDLPNIAAVLRVQRQIQAKRVAQLRHLAGAAPSPSIAPRDRPGRCESSKIPASAPTRALEEPKELV